MTDNQDTGDVANQRSPQPQSDSYTTRAGTVSAAFAMIAAIAWLHVALDATSADTGIYVALAIQLGLSVLWTWEARQYRRC